MCDQINIFHKKKFFSRKNMHIEQLVQKIGYYQYILILPE